MDIIPFLQDTLGFSKNASLQLRTVDGRNPAPNGMYKTLQIVGQTTNLNWWVYRISEPSTVVIGD